jgi:glycosyltransferase involved in cell wall biosynthesis
MASGVLWVDVGDLFWWPHDHVTGIQRTMASVIVELVEAPPSGVDVRFCAYTPERDFHQVPAPRVMERSLSLLGLAPSSAPPPAAAAPPARRRFRPVLWLAKAFLRCLPGELRGPMRDFCYAGDTLVRATWRWMTRPFRRPVPPPVVEALAAGDTLLNIGSSWINPTYNDFVRREKARCGLRYVVLLYDCNPYSVPQFHTEEAVKRFCAWAEDTVGIADRLLTISRYSQTDLLRFMRERALPEKIPVVLHLADKMAPPRRATTGRADLAPLFAGGNYILTISSIAPSKNHVVVVRAFKLLRGRGVTLPPILWGGVVIRPEAVDALLESDPELAAGILRAGILDEDDLKLAYQHCRFTIFPSKFEGWGLPVAESLQFGKVCLASNATSIPEIGGALVDYFDPDDAERLAALIEQYLDDARLAAREAEIASGFRATTWADTLREIMAALD